MSTSTRPPSSSYGALVQDNLESSSLSKHTNNKCSEWQSIFNLVSLITGCGMLALPYAACLLGWSAVGLLIVVACVFLYAFYLIAEALESCIRTDYSERLQSLPSSSSEIEDQKDNFEQAMKAMDDHESFINSLTYVTLAERAFGSHGAMLVSLSLSFELFLALVSFFINIGLNLQIVFPSLDVVYGISIAAVLTLVMSLMGLKYAAYTSALGVCLTSLLLVALIVAGLQLPTDTITTTTTTNNNNNNNSKMGTSTALHPRQYTLFVPSHLPMSLGLIAFCFGGIGAYPQIYTSMTNRDRHQKTLITAGGVTLSLYAAIMITGYFFYAQYTEIPVSENIGRDYLGNDLPSGATLRIIAALGIIFNIQVTCPLIVLPIRDILVNMVGNVSRRCYGCYRSQSGPGSGIGPELMGSEIQMERCMDDSSHHSSNHNHHHSHNHNPNRHHTESSLVVSTPPSTTLTQFCTVITVGSVFLCSLIFRHNFANICALIGDVITLINSLILPLAFYHLLYLAPLNTSTSTSTSSYVPYIQRINIYILHSAIILLAVVTAVIGAGGNVCEILQSKSHFCTSITATSR